MCDGRIRPNSGGSPAGGSKRKPKPPAGWVVKRMFAEAHLKELKAAVTERRLIIVAGAGVCWEAGLPLWQDLLCELMPGFLRARGPEGGKTADQMCAIAENFPLQAADVWWGWLDRHDGAPAIASFFEETFIRDKKPTRTHEQIAELCRLSGPGVITTNFDRLFELCAPELQRRTHSDSNLGLLFRLGAGKFLLKLHGTAENVESVVITARQYGQQSLRNAYAAVLDAIQLNSTLLFLGYGGRDPDIDHLRGQLVARFSGNVPNIFMLLDRPDPVLSESLRANRVVVAEFDGPRDGYEGVNELLNDLSAEGRASEAKPSASTRVRTGDVEMPTEYIDALRRHLELASFIGPRTGELPRQPPKIESIYVPVQIDIATGRGLDRAKPDMFSAQRTTFRSAWERWQPDNDGPMVILGGPGAGKTTLLKHLGLLALNATSSRGSRSGADMTMAPGSVPVFVRLSKLKDLAPGIPDVLASCPPQVDLQIASSFFKRALDSGACLLLLDGLDEAADRERTAELSRWVMRIHRTFRKSRLVLTSRYVGYRGDAVLKLPHWTTSLVPLSDPEIRVFLDRWYESLGESLGDDPKRAPQLAAQLAEVLSSPERADLRSLASTPLMLLIMALIHSSGKGLPDRRVDLYDLCVDILLEHWNKENDRKYIPAKLGRAVLRPLAFWLHSHSQKYSASVKELEPIIGPELERTPQLPYRDTTTFLESVRDLSGLFTGQSEDEYSFLHPTFQEYLAAEHVKTEPAAMPQRKRQRRPRLR